MKPKKLWNEKRFAQKGKRLEFAFEGESVVTIRVGGGVCIGLGDNFATQIDLWMPFRLSQYGQSATLNPHHSASLAPLLSLIGATVVKAEAASQSPLILTFDSGTTIETPAVPEDYRWETWRISDRYGFEVVCSIGGEMAVWPPLKKEHGGKESGRS